MICILILILIRGLLYKRNIFKDIDKRVYKYRFLYGVSAVLIDFCNSYIHKINYEKIKIRLNKLKLSNVTEKEVYIDLVERVSLALIFFLIITFGGYMKCCLDYFENDKEILYIERPEYGEGERNVNFIVKDIDKETDITVSINERTYTKEEVYQMFTDSYENLITEFLGNNKSLDCITDDINLITSLDNGISIDWLIEENIPIDYSGAIKWMEVNQKSELEIEAVMSYGDYSQNYIIKIVIDKDKRDRNKLIKEDIQVLLNEQDKTNKKINIESIADKYNVKFIKNRDKESLIFLVFGVVVSVAIFIAKGKDDEKDLNIRREELEADYSIIISKLTVLQNAGLNTLNAWDKIITDYENGNIEKKQIEKRYVYEEMKYARKIMEMGYSEAAAYLEFGRRCGTHSYIKLSNILEQNLRKGNKRMNEILKEEVREALEERKLLARKKGDLAGTKLLIPMGIMLIVSIVIIMVPALLTINI